MLSAILVGFRWAGASDVSLAFFSLLLWEELGSPGFFRSFFADYSPKPNILLKSREVDTWDMQHEEVLKKGAGFSCCCL